MSQKQAQGPEIPATDSLHEVSCCDVSENATSCSSVQNKIHANIIKLYKKCALNDTNNVSFLLKHKASAAFKQFIIQRKIYFEVAKLKAARPKVGVMYRKQRGAFRLCCFNFRAQ